MARSASRSLLNAENPIRQARPWLLPQTQHLPTCKEVIAKSANLARLSGDLRERLYCALSKKEVGLIAMVNKHESAHATRVQSRRARAELELLREEHNLWRNYPMIWYPSREYFNLIPDDNRRFLITLGSSDYWTWITDAEEESDLKRLCAAINVAATDLNVCTFTEKEVFSACSFQACLQCPAGLIRRWLLDKSSNVWKHLTFNRIAMDSHVCIEEADEGDHNPTIFNGKLLHNFPTYVFLD